MYFGHFERKYQQSDDWYILQSFAPVINADWCRGSRDMIVRKPARFVDPRGKIWEVGDGDRTNGHSIPWFLRRIFQPYEGVTREAAVFHDVHCVKRTADSDEVHWMFYEAMRANGASRLRAYLMWRGVHYFGPRFKAKQDAS